MNVRESDIGIEHRYIESSKSQYYTLVLLVTLLATVHRQNSLDVDDVDVTKFRQYLSQLRNCNIEHPTNRRRLLFSYG